MRYQLAPSEKTVMTLLLAPGAARANVPAESIAAMPTTPHVWTALVRLMVIVSPVLVAAAGRVNRVAAAAAQRMSSSLSVSVDVAVMGR